MPKRYIKVCFEPLINLNYSISLVNSCFPICALILQSNNLERSQEVTSTLIMTDKTAFLLRIPS